MGSKRQRRRRDCAGKAKYFNEAVAVFVRDDNFRQGGDRLHVYRCVRCGFYHIGHTTARSQTSQSTGRLRRRDARWIMAERELYRPPPAISPHHVVETFNPPRFAALEEYSGGQKEG